MDEFDLKKATSEVVRSKRPPEVFQQLVKSNTEQEAFSKKEKEDTKEDRWARIQARISSKISSLFPEFNGIVVIPDSHLPECLITPNLTKAMVYYDGYFDMLYDPGQDWNLQVSTGQLDSPGGKMARSTPRELLESVRDAWGRLYSFAMKPFRSQGGFIAMMRNGPANVAVPWALDSGASFHMTGDINMLMGLHWAETKTVRAANGQPMQSYRCGRVDDGVVKLCEVRYVEGVAMNLISAGLLVRRGCQINISDEGVVKIQKDGVLVGEGHLRLDNDLLQVDYLDDSLLREPKCGRCQAPLNGYQFL